MKRKSVCIMFGCVIVCCLCSGIYALFRYQQTSNRRLENQYSEDIVKLQSTIDKDKDGIDDQTDILNSALMYIDTQPKYKSKYYETGYPNDEYGVCTDVVGNALKSAGYDLQELVDTDITLNRNDYDIDEPNPDIDFRRVRNLSIYLKNNAISLTTDISDIETWQGGDIVVFQNHIGIISDRRNENGIPFVIHHNSPWQKSYEEDILEKRKDIVGHYRISE